MTRWVLAAGAAVLVFVAWLARYDIVPVARGGEGGSGVTAAYVLDRWTGGVTLIYAGQHMPVVPRPPQ